MLSIQPDEITSILREQIKKYEGKLTDTSTGTVLSVGDGIARIHGLVRRKGLWRCRWVRSRIVGWR